MTHAVVPGASLQGAVDPRTTPAVELAGLVDGTLFDGVAAERIRVLEARRSLLALPSALDGAPAYAFTLHRLAAATEAAEEGDRLAFARFRGESGLAALEDEAVALHDGGSVVVRSWDGTGGDQGRYGDMPCLPVCLLPPTVPAALMDLARQAVRVAEVGGFARLLTRACAVVVLLKERTLDEVSSSWTTSALPCTVFSDFHRDPALLAVDIVHETTHNLLNEIIRARRIELPDAPAYFSPWKRTDRPAFGFFHSVIAFSAVVTALRACSRACSTPAHRDYAARRLDIERGRLELVRPDFERLLEVDVRDPDLVGAAIAAYGRALG